MKKKILIAFKDDFKRGVYSDLFRNEKFEVFEADDGEKALILAKKEIPDIILADVFLSGIAEEKGFQLIESLKRESSTQKIPVFIISQYEEEKYRNRAIELEVRNFIIAARVPPLEVVLKTRIHLGEQKTYQFPVDENIEIVKELAKDLRYNSTLKCPKCGASLVLYLIRDFSKGSDYFKVSFICPQHG